MNAKSGWLNALLWRLKAMRRLWKRGASPSMTFLPIGKVLADPHGHLDSLPRKLRRTSVAVKGWVLFPSEPTDRVELFLDDELLGRARLGIARVDVGLLVDAPHAAVAGFELNADLTEWNGPDGEASLVAVATSAAGERYELEPLPVTITSEPPPDSKLPPTQPVERDLHGPRPRVLVFTHQLGLGGAQLYLLDLLRQLVRTEAGGFVVVSPLDGPVREDLEAIGIPVHISSPVPFDDIGSHLGRVEELAAWAEPRNFDAVLINTATTLSFAGAEVAERLDLPVVWAIHESFPPSFLWADLSPEVHERLDRALTRSSFLVFEADATKRLFEPTAGSARCLTLPYGLDLEPIDQARSQFDRAKARQKAGIPADAEAIVCIGTVEPRKAQALLAQAFDRIAGRHPRAHLYFVGGREDENSEALLSYIEADSTSDRIELIPLTPEVQLWYGLADLLVCASDVESLPRTVLEAMAWETPVLATDVFGLPELITDGETGWLCEARNLDALTQALDQVLDTPRETCERIARQGRVLVQKRHSLPRYAEQISKLLREAGAASEESKRRIGSR